MTPPAIDIVGMGEDGLDGLSGPARAAVLQADTLIGGARLLALIDAAGAAPAAERLRWPSPFSLLLEDIAARADRRVVALVSGDPMWFSAGAQLIAALGPDRARAHPHPSSFQWAAARMGWPLGAVETLTAHGRPATRILPRLAPGARLLILAADATTPGEIARLATTAGFGPSRLTLLGRLGGPEESVRTDSAAAWRNDPSDPGLAVIALECRLREGAPAAPLGPGLPDDAFVHDGKITKRELRAVTLSLLAPRPDALLWDVGAGCGSVAVEWLRLAPRGRAIGLEPHAERRAMAALNAERLGAPDLTLLDARAPQGLAGLEPPDAIFIGGGLSAGLGAGLGGGESEDAQESVKSSVKASERVGEGAAIICACLAALKPHGRLVANAVTLESEAVLIAAQARHGGSLSRISVSRAEPVGGFRGWRPMMPVTQWSLSA